MIYWTSTLCRCRQAGSEGHRVGGPTGPAEMVLGFVIDRNQTKPKKVKTKFIE